MNKKIFTLSFIISILIYGISTAFGATGPPTGGEIRDATSSDVFLLILYILLALIFSFLCSIAEAALLNVTPSYIAELQEKSPEYAAVVKRIRQTNIDQSLAAILTMNTIAHTVGAIGSGAQAIIVFGNAWFGVFSAVMTLAILFISEIIPKTIGVVYWRGLLKPVVAYIRILNFILYPFIWISEKITQLIAKDKSGHIFSRDEFVAMAGIGQKSGDLNKREFMIIQNLFRIASLTTEDIYTPRTVIVGFNENTTIAKALENKNTLSFSRVIVHEGDLDKVTGFVLTDEMLLLKGEGKEDTKLKELKRDIMMVPKDYTVSHLLEEFLQKKYQIAIVADQFHTAGLVTIEDIMETLLGMEIVDENDSIEDMRKLAKQIWQNRMRSMGIDPDNQPIEEPLDPDNTNNAE